MPRVVTDSYLGASSAIWVDTSTQNRVAIQLSYAPIIYPEGTEFPVQWVIVSFVTPEEFVDFVRWQRAKIQSLQGPYR